MNGGQEAQGGGAAASTSANNEMAGRIATFDWGATSIGRRSSWPASLRTAVDILLDSPQPAYIGWGPTLCSFYNDAMVPILGDKHPNCLGRAFKEAFSEIWQEFSPLIEVTLAGQAQYFVNRRVLLDGRPGRREGWFTFSWTPLRGATAEVCGFYCNATETTDVVNAERDSRERMLQFQTLVDSAPMGIYLIDADFKIRHTNPIAAPVFDEAQRAIGADFEAVVRFLWHEEYAAEIIRAFRDTLQTGVSNVQNERAELRRDLDKVEYYDWRVDRILLPDDRHGLVCYFKEVSEQVIIRKAITASEQRLQSLIDGVPQLVWRANPLGERTWSSPQWMRLTGQIQADSRGVGWLDVIHPEDRSRVATAWERALSSGIFTAEYRINSSEEHRFRWFQNRALPVRSERGSIVEWLGTSTDVDDLRQLQARQEVLLAELQHRTRNLMAVVRAMADKVLDSSRDLAEFRDSFRNRLAALARVQGLLSRLKDGDRVTFDELILTELSALGVLHGAAKVSLQGPLGVKLRSSTVQTFAMAIHELATNAIKYGAFAQPRGRLQLVWAVYQSNKDGEPWLRVDWREHDVELASTDIAAITSGEGRDLIERALPYQLGAITTYAIEPDGVHCTVALPVSSRTGAEVI